MLITNNLSLKDNQIKTINSNDNIDSIIVNDNNNSNFNNYKNNNNIMNNNLNRLDTTESFFDDLNSDSEDDVIFIDKIIDNNQIKNNKKNIIIPPIDLKQIEYNKRKFKKKEDEEISLTRSRYDDDSLVESKIKRIKQKIKNFKRRVKTKLEKIKKYEQRIPEMETYFRNKGIIYKEDLMKRTELKSERISLSKIVEENDLNSH